MAGQRIASQLRKLSLGAFQKCCLNRIGAWTSRQPRNVCALSRACETEGRRAVLEHQPSKNGKEDRAIRSAMNRKSQARDAITRIAHRLGYELVYGFTIALPFSTDYETPK
jgi:ferric-dicitrate binding protein FerR (iron transport regulator)